MKKMYRNELGYRNVEQADIFREPNRHNRALDIHNKAVRDNWYPGENRMTEQDHLDVISELEEEQEQTLQYL